MRLATKSILYFVSDVGTSVVGFLATLYFARVLGPDPLGRYFVVVALLGWATIPTNGIGAAVNKRVSEGRDRHRMFSAGAALALTYWALISVAVVVAGRRLDAYVGASVVPYLVAILLAHIAFTVALEGIKGRKMIAHAGFLRTGDRAMRALAQVALIYLGYSVLGLIAGHVAALVASAAVGTVLFGVRPRLPDMASIREILSFGRYSWLGKMKSKTFGWMDTIVLSLFVSAGLIGVYEVSWRLASILILVSNAVEHTLFPEFSEVSAEGDVEQVQELLGEALFFAGIFVIPGLFGVLVMGPRILRIYGGEFVKGAPILAILVLARTVNVYEMQFLNAINGVNRPDVAFRINVVFVLSNAILNLVLVFLYGWYGAAVATAVSSLVILLLSYRSVDRIVGVGSLPLVGIGKQIGAAVGMAVVLLVARWAVPASNMYVTVAMVLFGAGVYGGLLYGTSARVRSKTASLVG